jgi:hypothetical protein
MSENLSKLRRKLLKLAEKLTKIDKVRITIVKRPGKPECKVLLERHEMIIRLYNVDPSNTISLKNYILDEIIAEGLGSSGKLLKAILAIVYSVLFGFLPMFSSESIWYTVIVVMILVLSIAMAVIIERAEKRSTRKSLTKVKEVMKIDGLTGNLIEVLGRYIDCLISKTNVREPKGNLINTVLDKNIVEYCRERMTSEVLTFKRMIRS